jgi:hypothetical protein
MKKRLLFSALATLILLGANAFMLNLEGQVNVTFVNDSADVGTSAMGGIQPVTLYFRINGEGKVALDARTRSDNADIIRVVDGWDSDSVGTTDNTSLFGKSFALVVTANKRLQSGYSETGQRGGLGVSGKNQRRIDDGGNEYVYFKLYGDVGLEFTSFAYSDVNNGASGKPNFRLMDNDSDETYFFKKPVLTSDSVFILPAGDLSLMYPLDTLSVTTSDTITGADGNEGARLYGLGFNVVELATPKPLPTGQFALDFVNESATDYGNPNGLHPLTFAYTIGAAGKISLDASTGSDFQDNIDLVNSWDSDSVGTTENAALFGKSFSLTATTNNRIQVGSGGGMGVQGRNQWRFDDGGTEYVYFTLEGDAGLEVLQFKFRDINEAGADLANFRISDYKTDKTYYVDIIGGDVGFYDVPEGELTLRYRTDVLTVTTSDTVSGDAGGRLYGFVFNVTEPVVKPPEVLTTSPVHGDTLVPVSTDYVIQFDAEMDRETTAAAISFAPGVSNRTNSWNDEGNAITISFDDLPNFTIFEVTVGEGIKGTNGLNALSDTVFTFRTLPEPPTVVFTYPSDQGKNIPVNTPLTIEFSQSMNRDSVEKAISFNPELSGLSFAWNGSSTKVYVTTDNMASGTQYTGTISVVASSAYSIPMTEPFVFEFSIAAGVSVENKTLANVVIYPNPVSEVLYIKGMEVASINIYSITGRLMKSRSNSNEISVSDIAPGSYILTASDRDNQRVRKLIVIK